MGIIKNYDTLNSNENRKIALELIETAFSSLTPQEIFKNFLFEDNKLKILEEEFDLSNFDRVFLVGFGKGSAEMSRIIEEKLGDRLTVGYDIDVVDETPFKKIEYTKGTHPLPSQENFDYTAKVIEKLTGLTEKDFVIVVTCGGGSALFEKPNTFSLEEMQKMNKGLLECGATISEMNTIRKHVSQVKGGGLAKILYPASVVNIIFSDVPGNDLSVIASAPLVKDPTTIEEAKEVIKKYNLTIPTESDLVERPKEDKYFEKVKNILMLSNLTAINAMAKKAEELGFTPRTLTDRLQGDARVTGEKLINETHSGEILLAGGETTMKVVGRGLGGRNQALALFSLPFLDENTLLVSFSTDGWDFYWFAGAMVDKDTKKKIKEMNIDVNEYLDDDNSYGLLERIGDGIRTGKQESNVSDLYIVIKR
ncbi:MAG TPA: DUF4147 domain-containing protein [Patescibacteria group bacterium]